MPTTGRVLISVRDADKGAAVEIATQLHSLGFSLVATRGTAAAIENAGVPCKHINKVKEGRPHVVDIIKNDDVHLIINTTEGKQAIVDSYAIRGSALSRKVMYTTTIAGAQALCTALALRGEMGVSSLQELHTRVAYWQLVDM